ncbi:MAG: hypothetical protein WCX96_03995, partial [Bacilli bacterium]
YDDGDELYELKGMERHLTEKKFNEKYIGYIWNQNDLNYDILKEMISNYSMDHSIENKGRGAM